MQTSSQILERERRWALPVALATFAGVGLVIAGFIVLHGAVSGGANFEGLHEAHENSSSVTLSGVLNALGFALLFAPLLYLFRAAQARSDKVKGQLAGLVVAAPVLLAIAGILLTVGTHEAANEYVGGEAKGTLSPREALRECRSEEKDKGAKEFGEAFPAGQGQTSLQACQSERLAEDTASKAVSDASFIQAGRVFGLAAGLAFVVALFYSCLWGMRTGLLSRFWGSLGMALGVATIVGLTQFTLLWFLYFGLLVAGWIPGGRPPAWKAGEAIPWPSPGEEAAAELEGNGDGEPSQAASLEESGGQGVDSEPEQPPRKRKQRD